MTDAPEYDVFEVPVAGGALSVGRWWGGEHAPVVLAAHGITASHLAWAQVARALGGRITLIAADLRGRGRSNELPEPFGMSAHADDLVAVLDHVGVSRSVLVGHSMGGFVATVAAVRHPDRFGPLVLVDGGLGFPVPPAADVDTMIAAVIGPAMTRLSMTFPSQQAYRDFWLQHPAFARDWSADVENYVDYDLVGAAPELRSACAIDAVRTDGADILLTVEVIDAIRHLPCEATLLWAARGLQDEPQGLYDEDRIALAGLDPERMHVEQVPDVNHYTVLLADRGAQVVAEYVLAATEL